MTALAHPHGYPGSARR